MPTVPDEICRAIKEEAPQIIGRKKLRKLLEAARENLINKLAENVDGPVAKNRREAVVFLSREISGCSCKDRSRA